MRVRIVSYENVNAWILGKFARKLNEELNKLGINSDISNQRDPNADINHHIIYLGYEPLHDSSVDTLMVTHIDDIRKLNLLKKQLETASAGICMSLPLMNQLMVGGIEANKLCYINPAHDQTVKIRPYVIGITSQVKPDGCKREHLLAELSEFISPELFHFKIMGSGWEAVNKVLRMRNIQVTYYPDFDYAEYMNIINSLDYYFYMGQDEGSMGYIDALAAGVETIVTPQGFHLDATGGITHPFNTLPELVSVFKLIEDKKRNLIDSVMYWTWKDYAVKHLEVWKHLIDPKEANSSVYKDGVNSLLSHAPVRMSNQLGYRMKLYIGTWNRTFYKIRTGFKDVETFKKKLKSLTRNILK